MKYTVYGTATVAVSIKVEAENEEDAIEQANENFQGLVSYVGGQYGNLIGVGQKNASLDPNDNFEFTEAVANE